MPVQVRVDEKAGSIFLICVFGFVPWADRYFGSFDWTQNLLGNFMFFVCVFSACYFYYSDQQKYLWAGMAAAMWILSNSFLHISCTILSGEYSPGVVTAALVYVPGGTYFLVRWGKKGWLTFNNLLFSFFIGGMVFMLIPTFARSIHFHARSAKLFHLVN